MEIVKIVLGLLMSAAFGYFLGSLNSAILVCRLSKGEDIREFGSKNAGLTNVLRVYGKKLALVTLICDLAKGIVAVLFARLVVGALMGVTVLGDELFVCYVAAFFTMLGHIYPIYYGFKGGKGVLVAATTLLALDPLSCVFALIVFAVILYFTKYVSLASMFSCLSAPVFTIISQAGRGIDSYAVNALMLYCLALLIVYKHKPNIERLNNGVENKFSFGSHKRKKE